MATLTLKIGDYTIEAIQDSPFSDVEIAVYDDAIQAIVPPELYDRKAARFLGENFGVTIAESLEEFRRICKAIEDLVFVDEACGV